MVLWNYKLIKLFTKYDLFMVRKEMARKMVGVQMDGVTGNCV